MWKKNNATNWVDARNTWNQNTNVPTVSPSSLITAATRITVYKQFMLNIVHSVNFAVCAVLNVWLVLGYFTVCASISPTRSVSIPIQFGLPTKQIKKKTNCQYVTLYIEHDFNFYIDYHSGIHLIRIWCDCHIIIGNILYCNKIYSIAQNGKNWCIFTQNLRRFEWCGNGCVAVLPRCWLLWWWACLHVEQQQRTTEKIALKVLWQSITKTPIVESHCESRGVIYSIADNITSQFSTNKFDEWVN